MQSKKAIICCLAVLMGLVIPFHQAAGYFAEDSFTAYWNKESVAKVSGKLFLLFILLSLVIPCGVSAAF